MAANADINSITKTKALKTASFLVEKYYDFLNRFRLNAGNYALDIAVIKDVARRYAYDVDRLHRYHGTERIDRHKIAGYLTYWICKLRPISLKNKDVYFENAKSPLFINETFALFIAMGRFNAHYVQTGSDRKMVVGESLLDAFLYDLRYRTTTGDMLSMAFYLAEKNGV